MYQTQSKTKKQLLCVLLLAFSLVPIKAFTQVDSLWNYHRKLADNYCEGGQGNGSFRITLPQLEQVFSAKYTIKSLLKLLPKHSCESTIAFNYNEKTKEHDVPQYEFKYPYLNPVGSSVIVTVNEKLTNNISTLTVNNIPGITYDTLLNQLPKSGYLYRASISNRSKRYYVNKAKSLMIVLMENSYGTYSVEVL